MRAVYVGLALAVAVSLVAGGLYYAKRSGYEQAKAEQAKEQTKAVEVTAKKYARIRNSDDAINELRIRAAAKHKARIQRGT